MKWLYVLIFSVLSCLYMNSQQKENSFQISIEKNESICTYKIGTVPPIDSILVNSQIDRQDYDKETNTCLVSYMKQVETLTAKLASRLNKNAINTVKPSKYGYKHFGLVVIYIDLDGNVLFSELLFDNNINDLLSYKEIENILLELHTTKFTPIQESTYHAIAKVGYMGFKTPLGIYVDRNK